MNIDYASLSPDDRARCNTYAQSACSTVQGVQQTFLLAEQLILNKVSGSFVECGVAAGAMIAAMTWACLKHGERRMIHLFDSFQGIPMAGPHDHDQPGLGSAFLMDRNAPISERLVSSGVSTCSKALVTRILTDWHLPLDNYVFHEGWFQRTLPGISMLPIAFLRLDGDLYESTECCLKWLYPFVVPGGIVLLDDYPLPGSRLAFEDYFELLKQPVPPVIKNVNTGAAYWLKT